MCDTWCLVHRPLGVDECGSSSCSRSSCSNRRAQGDRRSLIIPVPFVVSGIFLSPSKKKELSARQGYACCAGLWAYVFPAFSRSPQLSHPASNLLLLRPRSYRPGTAWLPASSAEKGEDREVRRSGLVTSRNFTVTPSGPKLTISSTCGPKRSPTVRGWFM